MYANLVNNLDELGFTEVEPFLSDYLTKVAKDGISVQDALTAITDREIELRNHRAAQIQVSVSHFPFVKTIDGYDFNFQPSVNKNEIKDFATLRFMENAENILFFGTPGTGKTHLATAIGIEAAKHRNITYFITCHDLIQTLRKAYEENRLEARLKHFFKIQTFDYRRNWLSSDRQNRSQPFLPAHCKTLRAQFNNYYYKSAIQQVGRCIFRCHACECDS